MHDIDAVHRHSEVLADRDRNPVVPTIGDLGPERAAPCVETPVLNAHPGPVHDIDRAVVAHPCAVVCDGVPDDVPVIRIAARTRYRGPGLGSNRRRGVEDVQSLVLHDEHRHPGERALIRLLVGTRPLEPDRLLRLPLGGHPLDGDAVSRRRAEGEARSHGQHGQEDGDARDPDPDAHVPAGKTIVLSSPPGRDLDGLPQWMRSPGTRIRSGLGRASKLSLDTAGGPSPALLSQGHFTRLGLRFQGPPARRARHRRLVHPVRSIPIGLRASSTGASGLPPRPDAT